MSEAGNVSALAALNTRNTQTSMRVSKKALDLEALARILRFLERAKSVSQLFEHEQQCITSTRVVARRSVVGNRYYPGGRFVDENR